MSSRFSSRISSKLVMFDLESVSCVSNSSTLSQTSSYCFCLSNNLEQYDSVVLIESVHVPTAIGTDIKLAQFAFSYKLFYNLGV